jgi:probable addiction module antidote protein
MKTSKWDLAESLETAEEIRDYIRFALEDNDTDFLFEIIGSLARAKGMTEIAKELGVTREGLYVSLGPAGNPSFATVAKLLGILGMRLTVKPAAPKEDQAA